MYQLSEVLNVLAAGRKRSAKGVEQRPCRPLNFLAKFFVALLVLLVLRDP